MTSDTEELHKGMKSTVKERIRPKEEAKPKSVSVAEIAFKDVHETARAIDAVRESMLRLKERASTGVYLEMRIWDIWAYVRENQNKLDSGRACAIVHEIVAEAVSDLQRRVEELTVELDRERRRGRKSGSITKVETSV